MRQVRGAVVRALRSRPSATPMELAAATGTARERVSEAVGRLAAEGLVAVRGDRVHLAE